MENLGDSLFLLGETRARSGILDFIENGNNLFLSFVSFQF